MLSSVTRRNSSSASAYSLLCKSSALFNRPDQIGSLSQFTQMASFSNSMFSIIPRHFDFTKSNTLAFRNFPTTYREFGDYTHPLSRMDEEDEGYSETCSKADNRPLLHSENIKDIVYRLFSQFSPTIGQLLVNEIFYPSFEHYSRRISRDNTLLANKDLKTILPLMSSSNNVQRFSWENRGVGCFDKELPYLSEAGPISAEAVMVFSKFRSDFLAGNTGSITENVNNTTTLKSVSAYRNDFLRHLLFLRMGTQSESFHYFSDFIPTTTTTTDQNSDQTPYYSHPLTGHFVWIPNNQDSLNMGISSQGLSHFVDSHLKAGTVYKKLCWFAYHVVSLSPASVRDNAIWLGKIWACFVQGLRTWLGVYEKSLYSILSKLSDSNDYGLLWITDRLSYLSKQIKFVGELCMLNAEQSSYPLLKLNGLGLLAYLMSKADQCMCHSSERIARFLFKEAAEPLIRFLENFSLDGIHDDDTNLEKQGDILWTKSLRILTYAKVLNIPVDIENVIRNYLAELLPEGFGEEIILCAKSMLLLKKICPKHFLFQTRSKFPNLCFLETIEQVSNYQDAYRKYQELLNNTATEHTATRKQKITQMIIERQKFLKHVKDIQTSRLAAIETKRIEQLEAHVVKQRAQLAELKLAAETAASRRREAIDAEKKADQMLLESIALSDKYKQEVINEAKAELEAYYANLTQEVDKHRADLDTHIKNDQILIETLEPNASKALQMKANRIAPMAYEVYSELTGEKLSTSKVQSSQSYPSDPMCIITDDQQEVVEREKTSACRVVSSNEENNKKSAINTSDGLSNDDPLNMLRIKFAQRNQGACTFKDQMSQLIYGSDDNRVNSVCTNKSQNTNRDRVAEANNSNPLKSIEMFKQRNKYGHSSDSTIQHILYGKGVGPSSRPSDDKLSKLSSNEVDELTEDKTNCLMAPLRVLIDRSIIRPLTLHVKYVNSALCNYFMFDLRLCDHFYCLYETYLLANGSFSQLLLSGLFEKAAGPIHHRASLFNTDYLQQLLKSVLTEMSSSHSALGKNTTNLDFITSNSYHNMNTPTALHTQPLLNSTHLLKHYLSLVSLVKSKKAAIISDTAAAAPTASKISSMNDYAEDSSSDPYDYISFNHLHLIYNTPWPLNQCFNSDIIQKYNYIFQRLIQCKFALWALNSCFQQLKNDRAYLLHHLLAVRKVLNMHLSNHITVCWSKFIKYLGLFNTYYNFMSDDNFPPSSRTCKRINESDPGVKDYEEGEEGTRSEQRIDSPAALYTAHERYLDEIISGCLLDACDNDFNQILRGMLTCAHQFHRALLTGRWIIKQSCQQSVFTNTTITPTSRNSSNCNEQSQAQSYHEQIEHTEWRQLYSIHASFRSYSQFLRRRINRLLVNYSGGVGGCGGNGGGGGGVKITRSKLAQLSLIFGMNDFYTLVDSTKQNNNNM
uniref:Gamma tubulin complex component C-terminal domain-containing protein n=1 Tax=Trichobilharzia regenti TaxID=157069 RepID=A0AA85KFL2_TRIRE|nr:unnamed protein product [Trichobilharzia regenti]